MLNQREHPLVIQSKNWFIEALLSLLQEKPFKEIKIKEIAEKAQLD
ncbi:hypothetical protein [Paenibacillus anaericanus]|nr:hypothetical protein [Paenibacillus anaericanus]